MSLLVAVQLVLLWLLTLCQCAQGLLPELLAMAVIYFMLHIDTCASPPPHTHTHSSTPHTHPLTLQSSSEEVCRVCGGQRFIMCLWCQGSKKGIRNTFGDLKCTVCNENALQKCPECSIWLHHHGSLPVPAHFTLYYISLIHKSVINNTFFWHSCTYRANTVTLTSDTQ